MKWMLCLLLAMLIASPAFGQATLKEVEALLAASEARMMGEFKKIKAELAIMNGGNEIRAETQPSPFVGRLLVFLGTALGTWILLSILDNHSRENERLKNGLRN